jgi:hypothetical protein
MPASADCRSFQAGGASIAAAPPAANATIHDLTKSLKLKAAWQVAATPFVRRLHLAGVLSDWSYRSLMIELSQRGKLDITLTRDIQADPVKRALASSLVSFGHEIPATIIAEGIETEEERSTLAALGVPWGQGFHLGRPNRPAK